MLKRFLTLGIIALFICCIIPITALSEEDIGSLSGYVTDEETNPIFEAKITIKCGDFFFECFSNEAGYYNIDNIPVVDCYWNVTIFKLGYDVNYIEIPIDENSVYDFILFSTYTIYVDDDNIEGPWDGSQNFPYKNVIDALENSSDGDTILVYNGTYFLNKSHIYINTSVELIGESRDGTIITSDNFPTLYFTKSNVSIISFTFENFTIFCGPILENDEEINYNIEISNNKLKTILGLAIFNSNNVEINGNIFLPLLEKNGFGIISFFNTNVNMVKNKISGFSYGVWCFNGDVVENNLFQNNYIAIQPLAGSVSSPCIIRNNNFINNKIHAFFNYAFLSKISDYLPSNLKNNLINELSLKNLQSSKNKIITQDLIWDGNYWDNWIGFGPKLIFGLNIIKGFPATFTIPWFTFDWHPAKEPYDINFPDT